MSRRGEWSIEVELLGKWRRLFVCTRGYGEGYIEHHKEAPGPRCALRLVKPDGSVADEVRELTEVSIGMVAGHPTAEQYERAGLQALERARQIREHEARVAARAAWRDPDVQPQTDGWPPGYRHTIEQVSAWTSHGWVNVDASRSARGYTFPEAARASAWLDAELGPGAKP